jgi:nucleolar protein 12
LSSGSGKEELAQVEDSPSSQLRSEQRKKKRKRNEVDEGLEDRYMQRLAEEEEKENAAKRDDEHSEGGDAKNSDASDDEDSPQNHAKNVVLLEQQDQSDSESDDEIPQHETLSKSHESPEIEKAARTVFLGNVSTDTITSKTAKKTLLRHLASYFDKLPASTPPHKVESIRFRSTAYSVKMPKKAAFMKRELMDTTTKGTNAYVVYSTKIAAREAPRYLNGSVVLNRHLRVDQVAHPAKVDNRRCVFVGNLGFVDDDTAMRESANQDKETKIRKREPGDAEEGLWQVFGKAGVVESVRVVRDAATRIGKGFAYVQFVDENAVEAALLLNEKKFPPLLPRKLRVARAKNLKHQDAKSARRAPARGTSDRTHQGRAGKLLGRAGASQARRQDGQVRKRQKMENNKVEEAGIKKPEQFVFEGQRAKSRDGKAGLNFGGKRKKVANARDSKSGKRAAAWRKKTEES